MNRWQAMGVVPVVFAGAAFGFFYAWVCSTLWGLDTLAPQAAIDAMNAMNESVRNPVFFAGFFLTPVVALVWGALLLWSGRRRAAIVAGVAAVVYVLGVVLLTNSFNLPLNDWLATVEVDDPAEVWSSYSGRWQVWNLVRTVVSGVVLAALACAVALAGDAPRSRRVGSGEPAVPVGAEA